jgi:hypothetical protein
MNNDLSRIAKDIDRDDLPYNIWFPTPADPDTLKELLRRQPWMGHQVLRALIFVGYQLYYDEFVPSVKLDKRLLEEAKGNPNPYFREDIERRAASQGIDLKTRTWSYPS